jgi:hypothetical protein
MDANVIAALGVASALAIVAGGPAAANVDAGLGPAHSFGLLSPVPKAEETLASVDATSMEPPQGAGLPQVHRHYRSSHHLHALTNIIEEHD